MTHMVSLIVATKDRPSDLTRLLESLRLQTIQPVEIVLVDSSSDPIQSLVAGFSGLNLRYLRHWPPSAAAQRNAGIRACMPAATLIGFADDDTVFEPNALERMLGFWESAEPDVLGVSFNIRNYPQRGKAMLKHSALAERLGLYSSRLGRVSPSGWQTIIVGIAETQFVDWVPSTAVVFRREVFDHNTFDEFFESYSYLEDLDLSYTLSRSGRLAVVADAGFSHFPSSGGRVSARVFGRYEVRNRLFFVRKHKLSLIRCYICFAIRLAISLGNGLIQRDVNLLFRALGNMQELMRLNSTSHSKIVESSLQS